MAAAGQPISGTVAVVAFAGELDAAQVRWSRECDAPIERSGGRVVVDLTNVTFIDSSVIRSLVLVHQRVVSHGWIRVVYTHHMIAQVIEICG